MKFYRSGLLVFVLFFSAFTVSEASYAKESYETKSSQKELLMKRLCEIGALKFGSFTLKSGKTSPIYFDLRIIVSYPDVLQLMGDCMWDQLEVQSQFVCGVPYTALPIATAMSLFHNIPMIVKRKEVKDHGTKKILEGVFKEGDSCLVVEDVITTGGSILETTQVLEQEGLKISHIIVCIDRQQGGMDNVHQKGYSISALYTATEILSLAHVAGFITDQQYTDIMLYLKNN